MSGGMGSGGLSDTGSVPTDLEAIYQGGQYFLERMKAMAAAREQHDAAYLALQVGQDARRALDDAGVKLADADRTRSAADDALVAAKIEAKRIVDEATEVAARLRADVSAWAEDLRATADKTRVAADDYASAKKAIADAAVSAAAAIRVQLNGQLDAARDAESAASAAKADAERATAHAVASRDVLSKKIAALHGALDDVVSINK